MHLDIESVHDSEIDPEWREGDDRLFTVEEWSTRPPLAEVPSADRIAEWVAEWACDEVTEDGAEQFYVAAKAEDVLAAAEALRVALASHVSYLMAETLLARHTIKVLPEGGWEMVSTAYTEQAIAAGFSGGGQAP